MFFNSLLSVTSHLVTVFETVFVIKELSDPDPFKNLQFCVSANIPPNVPFFPAAYHFSEKPAFSLALEMADEIVKVIEESDTTKDAQLNMLAKFNEIYEHCSSHDGLIMELT